MWMGLCLSSFRLSLSGCTHVGLTSPLLRSSFPPLQARGTLLEAAAICARALSVGLQLPRLLAHLGLVNFPGPRVCVLLSE